MKFRLSNNYQDIGCDAEISPKEVKQLDRDKLADLIKEAYYAAEEVFKNHPMFKTVILDTFSVEENQFIEQAKKKKGGSA